MQQLQQLARNLHNSFDLSGTRATAALKAANDKKTRETLFFNVLIQHFAALKEQLNTLQKFLSAKHESSLTPLRKTLESVIANDFPPRPTATEPQLQQQQPMGMYLPLSDEAFAFAQSYVGMLIATTQAQVVAELLAPGPDGAPPLVADPAHAAGIAAAVGGASADTIGVDRARGVVIRTAPRPEPIAEPISAAAKDDVAIDRREVATERAAKDQFRVEDGWMPIAEVKPAQFETVIDRIVREARTAAVAQHGVPEAIFSSAVEGKLRTILTGNFGMTRGMPGPLQSFSISITTNYGAGQGPRVTPGI